MENLQFKQWNELAEPRHQLDSPITIGNEDTLQLSALPEVSIPGINFNDYERVFLTSAIMNPLFPEKLLKSASLGDLEATLDLTSGKIALDHPMHSWNFDQNFPNQVDPEEIVEERSKSFKLTAPIVAFDKMLLIGLKENFLKNSPIFANQIAKSIVSKLAQDHFEGQIVVLGTSDQITELKPLSQNETKLSPPEFVTSFVGAILTQLIEKSLPFQGLIAPSEGPVGYEKLNLVTMEELITLCHAWVGGDKELYRSECYRRWRLDGAALGAQSGLYI